MHPLDGSVTVRVYVPMLVTEVLEELELLPPGFQRKFAPGVVDDPFNVTELVEQVMSCGLPAFTFGVVVLV
ncbi:MAG: hypothetical protein ACK5D5_04230 [Bacteroidota bacterium]